MRSLLLPDGIARKSIPQWLWLLVLAAALTAPLLLTGERTQDSWGLDQVWARQFSDQLATNPYPRWLERSFDGFGAPVFYFYPPLAFYLTAAVHYGSGAIFSPYQEVVLAAGIALFLCGLSMGLWLKEVGGRPWMAALYMLAPYHMMDLYVRGALAEFCAYAVVPLVMIGLKRALERRGMVLLAASYGALIMTHLPAALLVSALLVTPYALWRRGDLVRAAAGLALGIGLAAIYLVPALTLPFNVDLMTRQGLSVADAYFWNWGRGLAALAPMLAMTAFLAMAAWGRSFWSILAIALCLVVIGVLPVLMLPILSRVQFPWRALMLVEFCVVTRLALMTDRRWRLWALVFPAMLIGSLLHERETADQRRFPDATEYMPAQALPRAFDVDTLPAAPYLRLPERRVENGVVTLRKFNFPAWKSCQPIQGVLVNHPEGCAASIAVTPSEKLGAGLSLAALLGLFGLALWSRLRRGGPLQSRVGSPAPGSP